MGMQALWQIWSGKQLDTKTGPVSANCQVRDRSSLLELRHSAKPSFASARRGRISKDGGKVDPGRPDPKAI